MKQLSYALLASIFFMSCNQNKEQETPAEEKAVIEETDNFEWETEQFADIRMLRYRIDGWENLSLKQKELVYYLTQAGLAGRDIVWDQYYRHNLEIRRALETIVKDYEGDRDSDEQWYSPSL